MHPFYRGMIYFHVLFKLLSILTMPAMQTIRHRRFAKYVFIIAIPFIKVWLSNKQN